MPRSTSHAPVFVDVIGTGRRYHLIRLDTPPGSRSTALAMSSSGIVAGFLWQNHQSYACLWRAGCLSMIPIPAGKGSRATGVNAAGDVTGSASFKVRRAFKTSKGRPQWLQPLPGYKDADSLAINNQGIAAGWCYNDPARSADLVEGQPVIWRGNQPQRLTTPPGVSGAADAINDQGEVGGHITVFTKGRWQHRAVIWVGGQPKVLPNPAGWLAEWVTLIDDSGKALVEAHRVGEEPNDSAQRESAACFVWDHGKMVRIQVPGAKFVSPTGLDRSGAVVGYYQPASADEGWRSFWWDHDGVHLLKADSLPESQLCIKVGSGVSAQGALAATIAPASDPLLEAHAVVLQP
jgi:hypothetical protein